ncbi:hypothetical protein COLU111180_13305 [Cohnella lubricantis]|uniref:DUF4367 domain-containing protein n=1 Tax=Cohnella lubricantis TaxID=2163172 RepID=A0A841TC59_9BACL|nr:hypothetical protein [Cohnella lubricantis]MBB6676587.1 hypothetical protein [Cohnella lubricantis]MBP2117402.1 hypothetical protein [Cohnella lubricantis]
MIIAMLLVSLAGCASSFASSDRQPESNSRVDAPVVSSLTFSWPEKWRIQVISDKHADIYNDNDVYIGYISAIDVAKDFDFAQFKPNHSSIIDEESFDIPLGECSLYTLDADNGTAASGITGTHNEYYAVIRTANRTILIINWSMKDKKAETKQQLIGLLNKISVK